MTHTDPSGPVPVTHGLGPNAKIVEDGVFVPVVVLVGGYAYIQQAEQQIVMSAEMARQVAAVLMPSSGSNVVTVPSALRDVAGERQRQIEVLGWTPDHDDTHDCDQALARAAACYALAGASGNGPFWITHLLVPQQVWPYRWEWKPKDRRTNLVRAAALLVAEIERLDRATAPKPTGEGA